MRALAKLASVNNPDKIIFVGLQDPRHIDGMILTKFDTVDDKVGAALSMTYTTGQRFYSLEPVKRIQTQRT
ncbi:unnamed protein product [Rhizophagus irregularis]|nr:unnamed protein product [Rhizophagus irregularis]